MKHCIDSDWSSRFSHQTGNIQQHSCTRSDFNSLIRLMGLDTEKDMNSEMVDNIRHTIPTSNIEDIGSTYSIMFSEVPVNSWDSCSRNGVHLEREQLLVVDGNDDDFMKIFLSSLKNNTYVCTPHTIFTDAGSKWQLWKIGEYRKTNLWILHWSF